MNKTNKAITDLFKTLSKDEGLTSFSISVSSGIEKKETVNFTKEEIDEIANGGKK